jgi:hypothetical protein
MAPTAGPTNARSNPRGHGVPCPYKVEGAWANHRIVPTLNSKLSQMMVGMLIHQGGPFDWGQGDDRGRNVPLST